MGRDVLRSPLLRITTDFPDHHYGVGLWVFLERLQSVDVRGANNRVPTYADRRGEAEIAQLVHHLISQCAGLGYQSDTPRLGDVGGDNACVGLPRRDDARAVRPDKPR